jgi:hypothetical protein
LETISENRMPFAKRKIRQLSPCRLAAEQLRRHLVSPEKRGYKLPSTGALAAEFGISVPTLRKALAQLVEEGLLEAAKGSGYFVSAKVVAAAPVGLLFDLDLGTHPTANLTAMGILECQVALARLGRESRVYLGRKPYGDKSDRLDAVDLLKDLGSGRLSGVLDLSGRPSPELDEASRRFRLPLLGVGRYYDRGVRYDFEAFFRKALQVALRHGRRNIAFCAMQYVHPEKATDADAVRKVLREARVPVREGWIREDWHSSWAGAGWDSFRRLWGAAEEKPDALILGSPAFGREIVTAMADLGLRQPEDLLVVSAATRGDPVSGGFPWPKVEADPAETARLLCGIMDDLLSGRPVDTRMRAIDVWSVNDPLAEAVPAAPEKPVAGKKEKRARPSTTGISESFSRPRNDPGATSR